MRSKKDDTPSGTSPPVTAETIISDFVWIGDMAYFEEGLHELFLSFVTYEDNMDSVFKDQVIHTYTSLRELIRKVQQIETKIRPR